jgi:haloalkane dehalogenase
VTTVDDVERWFGPGARAETVDVLDSWVHHVERGSGRPVVMIHGNPTSSFLWRKVFRALGTPGRLLAVDLIGFGRSGKPEIAFDLDDHARYLDAWFDALALDDVTLVLQDYGSVLGLSWARRHPDRVRDVVLMEPILRAIDSAELDPGFVALRQQVLTPGVGEEIVLDQNRFVTELLPGSLVHGLSAEEQAVYEEPFPTVESRRPILFCPRALPVDGQPGSTMEVLDANARWLCDSAGVPKLLQTFEPGFLLTPSIAKWVTENVAEIEVEHLGHGVHWVQEDQPEAIAASIDRWLADRSASSGPIGEGA